MASWALRFTPLVGVDYERGLVLDITGTKRLHAGQENLLLKISNALETRGITARLCIAPTIGAAWAVAQCSSEKISLVKSAELKAYLLPLPLCALRLAPDVIQALEQIGVCTVQELIKLPRKGLSQRFGPEPLLRLDQAFGIRSEILECLHPSDALTESLAFDVPLTNHAILKAAILKLLKNLLLKLERQLLKAALFRIECFQAGKLAFKKELALYGSSNNFSHISSIIESALERLQAADGIGAIRVSALQTIRQISTQSDFERQGRDLDLKKAEGELINSLSARLGHENLALLELRESFVPENSYGYAALKAKQAPITETGPLTRPSYIFKTPQPILAISLLPDRPPTRIIWNEETLQIISAAIPEKISLEWWQHVIAPQEQRQLKDRLYFRVQDHLGRWLWVFRDSDMRWFVQGVWS